MKSKQLVKQISEATQKPETRELSDEEIRLRSIATRRMYNAVYKAKLVIN